jgi:hypothetical protein
VCSARVDNANRRGCEQPPWVPVIDSDAQAPEQDAAFAEGDDVMHAQSRKLRNSIIGLLVFLGLDVALLLSVPDLRTALDDVAHADPAWLGGAVALELLSCAGYAVLFGLVFGMLGRRLTSRLSPGCCAARASRSIASRGARC